MPFSREARQERQEVLRDVRGGAPLPRGTFRSTSDAASIHPPLCELGDLGVRNYEMKSENLPSVADPLGSASKLPHSGLLREACAALLSSGQLVRFRATGLSMDPTIRDGDVLTVEPVDLNEIRPGEVLLYRTERGVVAHRLVRYETVESQPLYILRGDASGTCDPPVCVGEVLGRVTAVRRGRRSRSLTNPWTRPWQITWAVAYRLARAVLRRVLRHSL